MTACPSKCVCDGKEAKYSEASLNSIPKCLCTGINKLNISHNNISIVKDCDLDNLHELRFLWLSNNGIKTVEPKVFCSTTQLTILDLHNNKLTFIDHKLFRCLEKLKYLYLNNNTISFIDSGLFEKNKNLCVLDLSHNRISAIEPKTFVNNKLISLLNAENNSITLPLYGIRESYTPFNVLDINFVGTCSWYIVSCQSIPNLDKLRENVIVSVSVSDLYNKTKSNLSQILQSRFQHEEQGAIYLIYNSTAGAVTTTSGAYLFCYSTSNSVWFWCNDNPYRNFDILFEKCNRNTKELSKTGTCESDFKINDTKKWEVAGIFLFVVITIIAVIRMTFLLTRLERINNGRHE
jgi:hypothetical protein